VVLSVQQVIIVYEYGIFLKSFAVYGANEKNNTKIAV
jgi:hypothetical protein